MRILFFLTLILLTSELHAYERYNFISENKGLEKKISLAFQNKKVSSPDQIREEISNYLKSNGYFTTNLKISGNNVQLRNASSWQFFFTGNDSFSRYNLRRILENSSYSQIDNAFLKETRQNITKAYLASGFHFVQVEANLVNTTKPFIKRIFFKIKEGKKVKINQVKLRGNYFPFKEKEIYQKIFNYSPEPTAKNIFNLNSIESGVTSLKNDLNNLGYFSAKVSIVEMDFNQAQDKVDIMIYVDVGSPTLVQKVTFKGNEKSSSFWLSEILNLKKGDVLNLYKLEEGLDLIEEYYLERGFLKIKVEKDDILRYSEDLKRVEISVPIDEGPQVLVSNITIKGSQKTKDFIILREITFKEGEVLTAGKMQASISNLTNLGYFSNININVLFKKSSQQGTPVEIIINERKSGSIILGLGMSNELNLTFKTFAGLDYKNIAGTGRAFSTKAELRKSISINYLENRIFFSYLEPYIFNTSTKARLNLSRSDEIWDVSDEKNEIATVIQSNRLDLILEKKLSPAITLYFAPLSLDIRKEEVINAAADSIKEFIGSFGPTLEIDYRNHQFLPSKGSFTRLQLEYASPFLGSKTKNSGGDDYDLEYLSFQGTYTYYKPLSKKFYWAQSARVGYIQNYPEATRAAPFPKSRAFFLGGASTIRGFDPSDPYERIPSDDALGLDARNRILNIPAYSYFYLLKSELRFPASPGSSWWWAFFYDGGGVQIGKSDYHLDPWRHSVGVGLRFHTPVGPLLNLEIAYKLDRKPQEAALGFHLSVSSF